MLDKLEAINERFEYLGEQLTDPEATSDMKRFTKISKEYKNLQEIVDVYNRYKLILTNIENNQTIVREEDDQEFIEMAKMELEELLPEREKIEEEIKILLIPKDPKDEKDVIVEIRAGTGGDEASIFAGDLFDMYGYYFKERGWKYEIVSETAGTVGGYSKLILEVNGDSVFGQLKYESGAHRVQRVPKTESQGRVHTSAATVVVMPQLEMEDVDINKADLKWDTFRSSGAGGQHVNKTESAVRVTHIPTGIVVECQDGRSQIKNREIALQRLYDRILEAQVEAHESDIAQTRKSLVTSGDRSEKIRTYNYPQNRMTDHRIGLTLYNLTDIMGGKEGKFQDIVDQLKMAENAEKMKEGIEE
ncbi:MAG: peptide chain release factor 1 [Bacteroidota bacterium]